MATGISLSAADKALHTSSEKANFQRLARLLMCGGLTLLREVFDSIHSPANLPAVLSHPATVRLLNGARLTRAERDRLYLPTGGYGTSRDFDITLLFRLLRVICNLTPPLRGWDCLPPSTDLSCEADLVRIKFYRNAIYGHNQTMEISDDEFVDRWREISEALLRIARSFSSAKRDEWKDSIDKFLRDPLTPDAQRSVEELQSWYKRDMDTKDEVERLRNEVEQLNIKQEQMIIMLRQVIDIHINVESFKAGGSSISSAQPINTLGLQDTGLQHVCIPITPDQSQEEGAVGQSTREIQPNQQDPPAFLRTIWHVILSCKNCLNNVVEYLSNLGVYVQGNRLGSLVITVSCSSLQVLERLWEDYCSGHLNKVVQQTLVTAEVLEELGLSEVKLKTTISEEEYKACEGFFMQSSGKRELELEIPPVDADVSVPSTLEKKELELETSSSGDADVSVPATLGKKELGFETPSGDADVSEPSRLGKKELKLEISSGDADVSAPSTVGKKGPEMKIPSGDADVNEPSTLAVARTLKGC